MGNLQRDRGVNKHKDALANEIADVLLVTLLIAERTNVDVNEALRKKMDIINERFK